MRIPERGVPSDSYDKVERVYFHKSTHKGFMSKFIGGGEWYNNNIPLMLYFSENNELKVDIHTLNT